MTFCTLTGASQLAGCPRLCHALAPVLSEPQEHTGNAPGGAEQDLLLAALLAAHANDNKLASACMQKAWASVVVRSSSMVLTEADVQALLEHVGAAEPLAVAETLAETSLQHAGSVRAPLWLDYHAEGSDSATELPQRTAFQSTWQLFTAGLRYSHQDVAGPEAWQAQALPIAVLGYASLGIHQAILSLLISALVLCFNLIVRLPMRLLKRSLGTPGAGLPGQYRPAVAMRVPLRHWAALPSSTVLQPLLDAAHTLGSSCSV